MLLFSKEELYYNVHVGRFKSSSHIIDDKVIRGKLFDVVENTMSFIISHLKVAFEITGKTTERVEIFEYPLSAIRELVLNAIVHRDYTNPTDIQIKIFDDKITIFNPGILYGGLTIEDLKTDDYQAQSRNKLIAEAFYLKKDIEKYGSGFRRIRAHIANYPTMYFDFKETSGGFLTILGYVQQKISNKIVDTDNDTDNDTDRKNLILSFIKKDSKITINELTKELTVSRSTILRSIKELKKANKLKRIGSEKSGYWKIL